MPDTDSESPLRASPRHLVRHDLWDRPPLTALPAVCVVRASLPLGGSRTLPRKRIRNELEAESDRPWRTASRPLGNPWADRYSRPADFPLGFTIAKLAMLAIAPMGRIHLPHATIITTTSRSRITPSAAPSDLRRCLTMLTTESPIAPNMMQPALTFQMKRSEVIASKSKSTSANTIWYPYPCPCTEN